MIRSTLALAVVSLLATSTFGQAPAGGYQVPAAQQQGYQIVGRLPNGQLVAVDRAGNRFVLPQPNAGSNNVLHENTGSYRGQGLTAEGTSRSAVLEANGETSVKRGEGGAYAVGAEGEANLIATDHRGNVATDTQRYLGVDVLSNQSEAGVRGTVGVRGSAEAGLYIDADPRLEANAEAFVGAEVNADGTTRTMVVGLGIGANGQANARAGAEGNANLKAGKEGVAGTVGGFAGARASAEGGGDIGGVGAKGTAEAQAGIGFEAAGAATFENGKLKIGYEQGVALGVGGKLGGELTIDVEKAQQEGQAAYENARKLYEQRQEIERQARIAAEQTRIAAEREAQRVAAEAARRAEQVRIAAEAARRAAEQEALRVQREAERQAQLAAQAAQRAAEDAARKAEREAKNVGNKIRGAFGF